MIDLIIPAYNAHSTIFRTLCSILTQSYKNILNVYIINDCSKDDYSSFVSFFSPYLSIREIKTEKNLGPGGARQLGIDFGDSKYVMFIDSDDIFYDCYAVEKIYKTIEEYKCNVVSGVFVEELENGTYINHDSDCIWLHGKIYRRDFLVENGIHFNNTFSNEDTGFNKLCSLYTNYIYSYDKIYIWKYSDKSLTRGSDYHFKGIEGFCYNICWAVDEYLKNNEANRNVGEIVFSTMLEVYYRYVYYRDRKDSKKIFKWANPLKKLYLEYIDLLDDITKTNLITRVWGDLLFTIGTVDIVLNNNLSFNEFVNMIDD